VLSGFTILDLVKKLQIMYCLKGDPTFIKVKENCISNKTSLNTMINSSAMPMYAYCQKIKSN